MSEATLQPASGPGREDGPPVAAEDVVAAEASTLATSLEDELATLEAALGRLEQGRYGTCETCRGPIDDAELEADPTATRCASHAGR